MTSDNDSATHVDAMGDETAVNLDGLQASVDGACAEIDRLRETNAELLAALMILHQASEGFVAVARFRDGDLREEATHRVRNAIAVARAAIAKAEGR